MLRRQFEAKLEGAKLEGDSVGLRLLRAGLERLQQAVYEEDFLVPALEAYSQSLRQACKAFVEVDVKSISLGFLVA